MQPAPQPQLGALPAARGAPLLARQLPAHAPPQQPQLVPGPTPPDQLAKVLAVLQALVANGDAPMLAGVVGSLQPAVLADVVMAYMQHLPPQHWLPLDSAPLEPWVLHLLQLVADQAMLPTAAPGQQQQQQAAVGGATLPQAAAAGVAASIPQDVQQPQLAGQQQQQQQKEQGEQRGGAGLSLHKAKQEAAATVAAKLAARPVPPVATFRLEPVPLTEQQQRQLRMAAVLRILQTDKTSRQQLRTALVAKLAAQTDGGMAPTIMQQLVQVRLGRGVPGQPDETQQQPASPHCATATFFPCHPVINNTSCSLCCLLQGIASSSASDSDSGTCCEMEVALQWLNVLYARECQAEAGEGAGAAEGQRPPLVAGSRSSSRASPSTAGSSPYEATLLQLLHGLRQALPPSSKVVVRWGTIGCCSCAPAFSASWASRLVARCLKTLAYPCSYANGCSFLAVHAVLFRVLLEAPALPMPAVRQFLQQVADGGPDWCTLALLAARDVILQRPPSREPLVQLVLDSCAAPTSDTRSKSVRLVANRLFSDAGMAPQIEQSARQRLDAMLLPAARPAADATAPKAEVRAGSPSDLAPSPGEDAPASAPAAGQGAAAGSPSDLQGQQATVEEDAEEAPAAATGPTDIEAAQLCALYCALCTKKHSLLRHLFEVYGQTSGRWPLTAYGCSTHMPLLAAAPPCVNGSTHPSLLPSS